MSTSICFPATQPRNVRIYGKLGAKFGRLFRLAVSSPAEAVRALCTQLPGFERELMESKDRGIGYVVYVGKRNVTEEELAWRSGCDDIRIAPVLTGAKKAGLGQIIIGVLLVAVGYAFAGVTGGASLVLVKFGMSMIIGGVIQLLMPAPKGPGDLDKPENRANYGFNGPVNTQAQGNPVPVLYGELITGSAVISAQINVQDQAYVPVNPDDDPDDDSWHGDRGGFASAPWHSYWQDFTQEA
jgi:predicted phage tail protein